jgi:uncharacterized protein
MSNFQPEAIVEQVFSQTRRELNLGLREYLDALKALQGGYGADSLDDLRLVLRSLWCHSIAEQSQFAIRWEEMVSVKQMRDDQDRIPSSLPDDRLERDTPPIHDEGSPLPEGFDLPEKSEEFQPLPIRVPQISADIEDLSEFQLYFPVTRRSMTYLWRYLRRPVADGSVDVLDLEATVEMAAKQGFFLAPSYRRREVNRAHLVLLIDRDGSMVPFHRFTRDLVDTAREDGQIERVDVFYFHNLLESYAYSDDRLTKPVLFDRVLAGCDRDTSVLIVSDAGAAKGYRRVERIRKTTDFLVKLKQRTNLTSWLNPMPIDRWRGSSAELIAYLVPMQQLDDDGMGNAIDIVRGQPLFHLHGDL